MAASSLIQCSLCNFQFSKPVDHVKHVVAFHQHQPQFLVQCSFQNCSQNFNKWTTFKKHIQRAHRDGEPIGYITDLDGENDIEEASSSAGSDRNVSDPTEENSDDDWDAAEYVLSLREQGLRMWNMSESALGAN